MNESLFGFPRTPHSLKQLYLSPNSSTRYSFSPSDVDFVVCHSAENSTATLVIPRSPKYSKTVFIANMSPGTTINILIDGNSTPSASLYYREFVQITCSSQLYTISSKGFVRTGKSLMSGIYPETGWIVRFPQITECNSMCVLSENNVNYLYMVLTYKAGSYTKSALAKADSNGKLIWSLMENTGDITFRHIISSVEQGTSYIYIVGSYMSGYYAFIAKLTKDAEIVWSKRFSTASTFYSCCLSYEGQDKYIYAVGTIRVSGSNNAYIVKLTTDGSVVWQKTYSASSFTKVVFSPEGYIYALNSGAIVKLSTEGTMIWQIGGISITIPTIENNTSYLYIGRQYSYDFVLSKITPSLSVVWSKKIPSQGSGETYMDSAVVVGNSIFVCGGLRISSYRHPYMFKISFDGSVEWQRYTYSGIYQTIYDIAKSVLVVSEKGLVYAYFFLIEEDSRHLMKYCLNYPTNGPVPDIPSIQILPISVPISDYPISLPTLSNTLSDVSNTIVSQSLSLIPITLFYSWSELL